MAENSSITPGGTLTVLCDDIISHINLILENYENNRLTVSMDEFAELYRLFQSVNIERVSDKNKYGYVETSLHFLTDLDVGSKYLPEKKERWGQYLEKVIAEKVLERPMSDTLTEPASTPNQDVTSEKTLVSMYYDITKITGKSYGRYGGSNQVQNFKEKSGPLLETDQCMYIFCDPDLISHVVEIRTRSGLIDKTVIYPFDLKESPYYPLKPLIKQCFIESRHANLVGMSDERIFHNVTLPLMWTKTKAMEMAANENKFSSKTFIWVDFGIFKINNGVHSSDEFHKMVDELDQEYVIFPYIFNTTPAEIRDRAQFYQKNRWKMIDGFFSVPGHLMREFVDAWTSELKLNLESGYPAQGEQVFSCVKASNPHLFKCYQADYKDIIANRFRMQTEHYLIMQNLRHCIELGCNEGIAEISPQLLKGVIPKNNYSVDQVLEVCNEILIGCWYLEEKRHLSREAAEKIKTLLPASTLPEGTKQNMISNMQFHGITPI